MYHYLEVMTYYVPLPGGYDVLCTTTWRLRRIMYHYLEVMTYYVPLPGGGGGDRKRGRGAFGASASRSCSPSCAPSSISFYSKQITRSERLADAAHAE